MPRPPPPQWLVNGRPTAQARQATEILTGAAVDGLTPADYSADALHDSVDAATRGTPLTGEGAAQLEQALTRSMERYLTDLHGGRIDPGAVKEDFADGRNAGFDAASVLSNAVTTRRLPDAVRDAAPSIPLYADLRSALARYRAMAASPELQRPLPALPGGSLKPGQSYKGTRELTQRLIALGDLPAGTAAPARYEGALIDGIKSFQTRHGLGADGALGKETLAQLQTPAASRARQIEITMERLRWTPLFNAPRIIAVNIPEFVLRAYEVRDGKVDIKLTMKVIVGKTLDTRTPLFNEDMQYIEFSPYWNIPPSIAKRETIPKLRNDPGYLARGGYEFVGGDGSVSNNVSAENLDAVLRGKMRIRQRPGPQNALGDIKFAFPNNQNIYLHHTPSVGLFERDRRDLSHGCIRVEAPVALAKFVLHDEPDWTEARIKTAMTSKKSNFKKLRDPLPVVITYGTAIVREDGRTFFFRDIYNHDKLLDDALRKETQRRQAHPLFAGAAGAPRTP